jgi:hypothetical protein
LLITLADVNDVSKIGGLFDPHGAAGKHRSRSMQSPATTRAAELNYWTNELNKPGLRRGTPAITVDKSF